MRLGVLSDIHANLPALEAALDFLKGAQVDKTICLGDLVGYGPHPREVVELVMELERESDGDFLVTLGGTDVRAVFPTLGRQKSPQSEQVMAWTREQLTEEQKEFLRRLPPSVRLATPYGRARGFHGHPQDPEAKFPLFAEDFELKKLLDQLRSRIILTGGSHVPLFREIGGYFVLDPGSVGFTLGGEPGADVAILTIRENEVKARIHKIPYDLAQTVFDLRAWGLPEHYAMVVQTGRPWRG